MEVAVKTFFLLFVFASVLNACAAESGAPESTDSKSFSGSEQSDTPRLPGEPGFNCSKCTDYDCTCYGPSCPSTDTFCCDQLKCR